MTLLKIFSLEDVKEENAFVLSEGQHIIGRGILNCHDKRVSRRHGLITISRDLVTIKAMHINPCFFKAANGNNLTILPKDTSNVLNDGDQFAFLASLFWYKVKVLKDNDTDVDHDLLEIVQEATNENSIVCNFISKNKINSSGTTMDINHVFCRKKNNCIEENLITKRQKTMNGTIDDTKEIDTSHETLIEPATSTDSSCLLDIPHNLKSENLMQHINSVKLINNLKNIFEEDYGIKNDNESQNIKQDCCTENEIDNFKEKNNSKINEKQSIKKEANMSDQKKVVDNNIMDAHNSGESSIQSKCVEQNTNNKATISDKDRVQNYGIVNIESDNPNKASCSSYIRNSRRERCWYGATCYRKNPVHRADFSHPGDNDYDIDSDNDRPLCLFGGTCYRRSFHHRKQYKHASALAKPNIGDINGKQNRNNIKTNHLDVGNNENSDNKPIKRKASMKKNNYYENPCDDYEYNDPFIDDATSDEFELLDDDDDSTDWEDSQKVEEESQETKCLLKEGKRFTK